MSRTYQVIDKAGLHARPAALVVNTTVKYPNNINIGYNGAEYNLKSIMIVMSLGIRYGDEFTITVEGENSEDVLDAIEMILKEHKIV